ncbi:MAG: class I SAM-dependent methyltransferase [Woeseiaceae bacterium]|nr:class I SAM-dependent methyltransferase [Woeseiaceae bacterium]
MVRAEQGWSEYWENEGAGGEVFVNARGEKHPALTEFWSGVFKSLPAGSRIIDIASGAGSIYGHLPTNHGFALSAADISAEALVTLESRIPGTTTIVCPADRIPVDDASFDLVVSQFGIEYAGRDAFAEAGRLVAPGGRLVVLAHVRGGYIDSRNKAQLEEAQLVADLRFIDHCLELINAAYSGDATGMQEAEAAFVPVASEIDAGIGRCRQGVHTHLLVGFRQLFERRNRYEKADITGWLEGMRGEVNRAVARLSHMRTAAMSAEDIGVIRDHLEKAGLDEVAIDQFRTPGNAQAVAWRIMASRPL